MNTPLHPPSQPALGLAFGIRFEDLHRRDGLLRIDAAFIDRLRETSPALADRLVETRANPDNADKKAESELLIALAPHLEDFVAELFGIQDAVARLQTRHHELAPLYACKRLFVQRKAMTRIKPEQAAEIDGPALEAELVSHLGGDFSELGFARLVAQWQKDEAAHAQELELALRYAAWAAHTAAGRARHRDGVLFKAPAKLDYQRLVPVTSRRARMAFAAIVWITCAAAKASQLTDPGTDLAGALDEAHYCIWCHEQGKDSCSHGLKEKTPGGRQRALPFKKSPFGVTLAGCPLEEKISEFHKVKREGCADRRAGDDLRRQPDGRRDRPPHLQRLHEVVHLSEAGAGQHPAGRDAHSEGRARAAVGLRDLLAAHALESAQSAPAVSASPRAASAC